MFTRTLSFIFLFLPIVLKYKSVFAFSGYSNMTVIYWKFIRFHHKLVIIRFSYIGSPRKKSCSSYS